MLWPWSVWKWNRNGWVYVYIDLHLHRYWHYDKNVPVLLHVSLVTTDSGLEFGTRNFKFSPFTLLYAPVMISLRETGSWTKSVMAPADRARLEPGQRKASTRWCSRTHRLFFPPEVNRGVIQIWRISNVELKRRTCVCLGMGMKYNVGVVAELL